MAITLLPNSNGGKPPFCTRLPACFCYPIKFKRLRKQTHCSSFICFYIMLKYLHRLGAILGDCEEAL